MWQESDNTQGAVYLVILNYRGIYKLFDVDVSDMVANYELCQNV